MNENLRFLPMVKDRLTDKIKSLTHSGSRLPRTRKEKITDLTRLKPGDHISFYKPDFYYAHHGIVVNVQPDALQMIHYFNTFENVWSTLHRGTVYIAAVIESVWKVKIPSTSEEIYLHHYDGITCFSNQETLERAYSQLDKRGYSLLGNNCEHWARWCRSGDAYSEQSVKVRTLIREKTATLLIIDPTALLVKDIAVVGAQGFGQFLSAIGSGLILTAVESASAYIDIKKQRNEKRKGGLSEMAFKKYVVRRITSGSVTVVGGTAGTIVGTIFIPVPILGATVGGVIGTLGGKILGGISGIAVSKIVEVYQQKKREKIMKMQTIPQLMGNISPNSQLLQGLMQLTLEREEEEEQVANAVEEVTQAKPAITSSLYPSLEEFTRDDHSVTSDKCDVVSQLAANLFPESNAFDYYVLTPLPDDNSPEEFAANSDLLVLRWPTNNTKPWESNEEKVLDINEQNINNE